MLIIFAPILAMAQQPRGLVPWTCANLIPCNICDLWVLADNIIRFLVFTLALPILVLALIIGGIVWMTSAGNPTRIEKGKNILTSSIIGVFIAFGGWLIVDTIITTFANNGVLTAPWNQIKECPKPIVSEPPVVKPPIGPPPTQNQCPGCVPIGNYPVKPKSCKDTGVGQTCQVNTVLSQQLAQLNESILTGPDKKIVFWQVTETWPPTITHQNQCHQAATCVDANLIGNQNNAKAADVKYFIEKARNNGLKAVYETKSQTKYNELVSAGVSKDNLLRLDAITAEHFSIYSNVLKY